MEKSNPDLLKFHQKNIDTNYVKIKTNYVKIKTNTTKAKLSASNVITEPLNILSAELIALNLPTAVRYAFMAMGGGIAAAIADGPIPVGDIVAAIIAIGGGVVIGYYWKDISPKWDGVVKAFKKAFSNVASSVEKALNEVVLTIQLDKAIDKVETEIKKYKYQINFYNATLKYGYGANVYYSQGNIGVKGAASRVLLNSKNLNVYCSDPYIAKVFAEAMPFGKGIRQPEGGPYTGEARHYHTYNVLTKNAHIFYGTDNIFPR